MSNGTSRSKLLTNVFDMIYCRQLKSTGMYLYDVLPKLSRSRCYRSFRLRMLFLSR